jgi:hypothetical protein
MFKPGDKIMYQRRLGKNKPIIWEESIILKENTTQFIIKNPTAPFLPKILYRLKSNVFPIQKELIGRVVT